jgi:hypothetical protein
MGAVDDVLSVHLSPHFPVWTLYKHGKCLRSGRMLGSKDISSSRPIGPLSGVVSPWKRPPAAHPRAEIHWGLFIQSA